MKNRINSTVLAIIVGIAPLLFMTAFRPANIASNTPTPIITKNLQLKEVALPLLKDAGFLSWIKWNPKSHQVAVAYKNNVDVAIFDIISNQIQFRLRKPIPIGINESVSQLSWSPDGRLLAIGFEDDAIFVWDVIASSPHIVSMIRQSGGFLLINWSPDSKNLVFTDRTGDSELSIWDITINKVVETLPKEDRALYWSPNGKQIAILKGGQDGEVLDAITRNAISNLPRSTKDSFILNHIVTSWSPDSQKLIGVDCNSTSSECVVWFRNLASSKLIVGSNSETTTLGVDTLAWRPAGDLVATNSGRSLLNIWDSNTGTLLGTIDSL